MFLLDSNHLSVLWYNEGIEFDALLKRINSFAEEAFAVSIVTFDEQLRGWQAYICALHRSRSLTTILF